MPSPEDAGRDLGDASVGGTDANDVDAGLTQDAGAQDDAGSEMDASVDAGIDAGPGNPCDTANGGCDSLTVCTVVNEQAACGACPAGYSGDGVTGCVDLDECTTLADAGCGATAFCTNTPGAFRCSERPIGTVTFEPQGTQAVGDTGATPHLQPCPQNQVSIGYSFGVNSISKITYATSVCSELTLGGPGPTGYVLTTTLPSVSPDARVCPANEVVVGMALATGVDLQSMTVRCAPISVQFDANTGFSMVTGTPHDLARFPYTTSPASNTGVACAAGAVGAGEVTYGGQYLFAYGMRCITPALRFTVPTISFGSTTDTPVIGTTGTSTDYRDLCPTGQMVTGIQLESQWRSFAVECGTPFFDLPLRVAVSPALPLGYHGMIAPRFAVSCPSNAAVTQFEMYTSSSSLIALTMNCAPLTAPSATPAWTVSVEPSTQAARLGTSVTPDKLTVCPAGQVAVGVKSKLTAQSNGYTTLTHLGLVCAAPQVP